MSGYYNAGRLLNEREILTGNGLFIIQAQAPKTIEAGGTVRFTSRFMHRKDGWVNPAGLTAKVYEGRVMKNLIATLVPQQDQSNGGTGCFFAEWSVDPSTGVGPYTCTFGGTYVSSDDTTQTAQPVQITIGTWVVNPWK